jgi:iron complex outermembrane receptor protein
VLPFTLFDSKLNSVFAEGVLRPTDNITVVGGIRYDRLEQLILNFRRGREIRAPFDDNELTARIGASLQATDNLNVYASYAQAFVPQFGLRRNNSAVEAETSDSVEVGVKGSAFNGLMTFETGLFRTLRKDVALNDPDNVPGEAFVVSAGEIRVQGLEFSAVIRPTPALNIILNLGYTDIDVVKAGSDEIAAPVFPEQTASLYLDYKIQSGVLEGLSIGGGVRHVGEREGPRVDWGSHSITDLNFGYTINGGLDLSFDILNVLDEQYVENTSTNTVNRLSGAAVLGAPLTAAFTLNWKI